MGSCRLDEATSTATSSLVTLPTAKELFSDAIIGRYIVQLLRRNGGKCTQPTNILFDYDLLSYIDGSVI